jgi:GntR family transcriptional repressor for pyruvate dehydrogenase complex
MTLGALIVAANTSSKSPEDLTARAYREVRRMIVEGEVRPRQRLSHRNLSRDLKIGRSPVRDALLQLEAEGLIEHRPGSGIYLREISPQELECIYDLRIINEPYLAGRAALYASVRQIAILRRICDEMTAMARKPDLAKWFAKLDNRRRFCRLDLEFHATILEASGNPVAVRIFGNAQVLALTFAWDLGHGSPEWFAEIMGRTSMGHRAIFEAIRRRDPDAARQKMADHVGWARHEVPEQYAAYLLTT